MAYLNNASNNCSRLPQRPDGRFGLHARLHMCAARKCKFGVRRRPLWEPSRGTLGSERLLEYSRAWTKIWQLQRGNFYPSHQSKNNHISCHREEESITASQFVPTFTGYGMTSLLRQVFQETHSNTVINGTAHMCSLSPHFSDMLAKSAGFLAEWQQTHTNIWHFFFLWMLCPIPVPCKGISVRNRDPCHIEVVGEGPLGHRGGNGFNKMAARNKKTKTQTILASAQDTGKQSRCWVLGNVTSGRRYKAEPILTTWDYYLTPWHWCDTTAHSYKWQLISDLQLKKW